MRFKTAALCMLIAACTPSDEGAQESTAIQLSFVWENLDQQRIDDLSVNCIEFKNTDITNVYRSSENVEISGRVLPDFGDRFIVSLALIHGNLIGEDAFSLRLFDRPSSAAATSFSGSFVERLIEAGGGSESDVSDMSIIQQIGGSELPHKYYVTNDSEFGPVHMVCDPTDSDLGQYCNIHWSDHPSGFGAVLAIDQQARSSWRSYLNSAVDLIEPRIKRGEDCKPFESQTGWQDSPAARPFQPTKTLPNEHFIPVMSGPTP